MNLPKTGIIIVCVFFLLNQFVYSQTDFKPEHISISNGLSNGEVASIYQDSYGFLWIGTADGLNQYDGYKFKVFKNVPGNTESLIDNDIRKVVEDNKKTYGLLLQRVFQCLTEKQISSLTTIWKNMLIMMQIKPMLYSSIQKIIYGSDR